jgi:hypothetical protein
MSIFHSDDVRRFDELLSTLRAVKEGLKELKHMATLLEQLTQGVAEENTAINSLIVLFDNFVAAANQNVNDPVAMQGLIDTVAKEKAAIIADVVKNTPQSPVISSLLPNSGPVGSTVVINGKGFGNTQSSSKISFNGVDAGLATDWNDTAITVAVPGGATTGPVKVVSNVGGASNTDMVFTVPDVVTPPVVQAPVEVAPTPTPTPTA